MVRRRRRVRTSRLSLPQMIPNLLTLGAICAGLTSMRLAFDERFGEAVGLIILAAAMDGMDGRLARLLRSESAIGAELDSLADFLNFGVATGLIIYLSMLQPLNNLGWIAVLIFVVCCVMRLARFNVSSRAVPEGPKPDGFVGVPSPAGALLALLPLFIAQATGGSLEVPALLAGVWLVIVGFLMISRLPTPAFKRLRIAPDMLRYLIIALVAVIAMLFTWPWWTLIAADIAYIGLLVHSVWTRPRNAEEGTTE